MNFTIKYLLQRTSIPIAYRNTRFLFGLTFLLMLSHEINASSLFDSTDCADFITEPSSPRLISLDNTESPLILDLPTAINMAMGANRHFANSLDNVIKSQLNVDLSISNFEWRITPNFDLGVIGGGDAGCGGTIGGSLELCKKFSQGTRLSITPYATKDAHKHHTGVRARIVQPLLRGFGREYTLAPVFAAKYSYRTAFRAAYSTSVDMIARLIQSMYSVIRMEELVKLDMEAYKRLKQFYSAIKIKERIGMADSLDVYRTETEMKSAKENIINSNELLQEARDRVREMLALPLEENIKINLSQEYSALDPDIEESIATALCNRIEIEQAYDRWEESRRLSRMAGNNTLPELDLVFDFTNIGRDEIFTNTFTNERDSQWGFGLMTSSGWDRQAAKVAYQQSMLNVDSAQRGYEQTQDAVTLEVKRAIRALKRTTQKIELQKQQIHSSEGGLKLARLKFNRGLANNFDVIQAEKSLRAAEAAHLSAIIEHKIDEYRFLAALGLLVDKPEIRQ